MEAEVNNCPQCGSRYSSRLPPSSEYRSKCTLPMTLHCGHGICYDCVMKRPVRESENNGKCSVICAVCQFLSPTCIPSGRQNISSSINCYQLGLLQLEELDVDIRGENIKFKDGKNGLFIPLPIQKKKKSQGCSGNNLSSKRKNYGHEGATTCSIHFQPLIYWCCDDESPACVSCRITAHVCHDVVKIEDKHKDELIDLQSVAYETLEKVEEMKRNLHLVETQADEVQQNYTSAIKKMRKHFRDIHSMLQAREQQIQQQLYKAMHSSFHPLKTIGSHLKEAVADIDFHLSQVDEMVLNAGREEILILTDSLRRLHPYPQALEEAVVANSNAKNPFLINLEPCSEFLIHLTGDPILKVQIQGSCKQGNWTEVEDRLVDLKKTKNEIVNSSYEGYPPFPQTPSSKESSLGMQIDPESLHLKCVPSSILSQAANYQAGVQISSIVTHFDAADRFYIQIQEQLEFSELQAQIQSEEEAVIIPSLTELKRGQLVAVKLNNQQWFRALIEEINFPCCDLFAFLIDVGLRELTSAQNVRLLQEQFFSIPAQSVCCVFSDPTARCHLALGKRLDLTVDRIEHGQVGRIYGSEFLLYVKMSNESKLGNLGQDHANSFLNVTRAESSSSLMWTSPSHEEDRRSLTSPKSLDLYPTPTKMKMKTSPSPTSRLSIFKNTVTSPSTLTELVLPPAIDINEENQHRTKVLLSDISSPGHFYVRTDDANKKLLHQTQQLRLYFESHMPHPLDPEEVVEGLVCALELSPGDWNRCRVLHGKKTGPRIDQLNVQLIDTGAVVTVTKNRLRYLDQPWRESPSLVMCCALWGLRPTGDAVKWPRKSTEEIQELAKNATALYIQVYYVNDDTHYVRLYSEYVQPGGPMECDSVLTGCFNDWVLDQGFALRSSMPVTIQPLIKHWLPSLALNPELQCEPSWLEDDGTVFIQQCSSPHCNLEVIKKTLNWFFSNSTPSPAELEHWERGELCIGLWSKNWSRAVVLEACDQTKLATLKFIDYGDEVKKIPYAKMRKTLVCFEYATQAIHCRFASYPGPHKPPTEDELEMLDQVIGRQPCLIQLATPKHFGGVTPATESPLLKDLPVIKIKLSSGKRNVELIFEELRTELPPTPLPASTPVLTVSSSSCSAFDASCNGLDSVPFSNSSDEEEIFKIPHSNEGNEVLNDHVFTQLAIPTGMFLPIEMISHDGFKAVIRPTRHMLNDSPQFWQDLVDEFAQLFSELQRSATLSRVVMDISDHDGSPCAVLYQDEWHRGIVRGYYDESWMTVQVELVDRDSIVVVSSENVKTLCPEYLNLPRQSANVLLVDSTTNLKYLPNAELLDCLINQRVPLRAFFKETTHPFQWNMNLFYQDSAGKFIPAFD